MPEKLLPPDVLAVRPATAARLIDISRTKVYELLAGGHLQAAQLGSRGKRILISEIERFLREGGTGGRPPEKS